MKKNLTLLVVSAALLGGALTACAGGNGDAKIIAITGNPTRTYGTAVSDMGITKITYGWTEAADITNAIIY